MRIVVTAGPTREYIDTVRFITNASSGQMGCAVAAAAARAGHDVTLLLGAGVSAGTALDECDRVVIVPFTTVDELRSELTECFAGCDALIMAAAVGDFRPEQTFGHKLPRSGRAITLKLIPTEDILADLARHKRQEQIVVAFAVEDAPGDQIEAKARREMQQKGADYVVVNTPEAMAAEESYACILSPDGFILPWDTRPKHQLAEKIVELLG